MAYWLAATIDHLKSEEATTDAGYDGADGSHEAPAGDVAPGTDTGTEVPDARTETALSTAPLVIGHRQAFCANRDRGGIPGGILARGPT